MSVYNSAFTQTGGDIRLSNDSVHPTGFADQSAKSADSRSPYQDDITTVSSPARSSNRREVIPRASSAEYRKLRMLCARAVEQCEQLVANAGLIEQYLDLGITGNALVDILNQMWRLKECRSKKWQIGLNFVQSALIDAAFEKLDTESSNHLLSAVKVLQSSELENEDTQAIKRSLKLANLDPWKAISTQE